MLKSYVEDLKDYQFGKLDPVVKEALLVKYPDGWKNHIQKRTMKMVQRAKLAFKSKPAQS